MTLQEARKVIGLNIHNLNGSMQMAVATIMDALEEKAEIIGHLQPSEDLEEAAEDGARQNYVAGGYSPFPNIEYGAYKNGFIAGAEWQKSQDESRRMVNIKLANTDVPVDTDMEIAFNDIWQDCEVRVERDGNLDEETTEAMKALCHDFFESGKEWQKERMLKGDRLTELNKSYKQAKRELEWFKEGKRQGREQMLKDLENAARDYTDGSDWQLGENLEHIDAAFKAGAEWQKEQMLKDAVEGKVVNLAETHKDLTISVEAKELNEVLRPLGVEDGDKAKIIIIPNKEDKK